ncbi:hypothetical protein A5893_02240 [Pedobacter psychrophilus]|uniref:Uncharacterized protein n=1 Tax=Pedobacter psychrophilus TaxID=1826909 RepID=A0A179DN44_9SPHI|nr:hypothetical protein [Pedobacter psychrophilus]OAQ41959.1 hypothetical protein A5893_02240 [Pedobacter psychrophilus]
MNKLTILILTIGLFSTRLLGQTVVDITETTLKVDGLGGEEILYYGFSEGDQLIFNFQEVNGKELKEIEIIELPTSSKFMDYKSTKIENKTLNITRTGIYKFRLLNNAIGGRICKVKIQRIPASEETKNFNSSVYWRTVQDTIYIPTLEKYLVKSDTTAQEIYSSNPQISSTNAINGNKNSQVIDFMLPANTISWSFYIGTGSEGKSEYDNARINFTQNAASSISKMPGYGPMAALALTGVSYFNKVQGEDNVKYWFLSDANSVALFNAGQTFMQYKRGDVVNEASQMKSPLKGKVYLALLNDNTVDPIKVTIKVAVVQVTQIWNTRTIQVMKVTNRQFAYLKN